MADEADSKSVVGNHVRVQVPLPAEKPRSLADGVFMCGGAERRKSSLFVILFHHLIWYDVLKDEREKAYSHGYADKKEKNWIQDIFSVSVKIYTGNKYHVL